MSVTVGTGVSVGKGSVGNGVCSGGVAVGDGTQAASKAEQEIRETRGTSRFNGMSEKKARSTRDNYR